MLKGERVHLEASADPKAFQRTCEAFNELFKGARPLSATYAIRPPTSQTYIRVGTSQDAGKRFPVSFDSTVFADGVYEMRIQMAMQAEEGAVDFLQEIHIPVMKLRASLKTRHRGVSAS